MDIGVVGARVATDGRTARLILADGRSLKYDGLKVTDARGPERASSFEARTDGVRTVVNAAGARFPITIPIGGGKFASSRAPTAARPRGYVPAVPRFAIVVAAPVNPHPTTSPRPRGAGA